MVGAHIERRIPWVALALSFLAMGVGHIYCGRVAKGLVLYVAWFAVPVLALLAALLPPSALALLFCLLGPVCVIFVTYFYAAVDAYRLAWRSDPHYKLQDYNRASLYGLLILVQLAGPIALTAGMREFVFEAFVVPARSMNPSILQGDRVLVNKMITRRRFPERGDVIVFYNPQPQGGLTFIKRVVALAGDTVVIEGNQISVNGQPLQRDRIPPAALRGIQNQLAGEAFYESNAGRRYKVVDGDRNGGGPACVRIELTVPERSVYVLGDNRDRSLDSRQFGAIHAGDIVGYVQYIYYPAETWSRFGVYQD